MASNTAIVVESGVVESHISDHYLVYSVLNLKLPKPPPTYVTARTYRCYDPDKFVDELVQLSWAWNDNSMFDDINEKLEYFNHNFLEVLNRHAPIKSMRIRYRQCPFIDHEIKELMDARDRLHKCARLTGIPMDWEIYGLSRDQVKDKLRNAEKEYLQNEINNQKGNSMWKTIGNCIPRKEVTQPVYTRDMKILAEEFNEFFTSVELARQKQRRN